MLNHSGVKCVARRATSQMSRSMLAATAWAPARFCADAKSEKKAEEPKHAEESPAKEEPKKAEDAGEQTLDKVEAALAGAKLELEEKEAEVKELKKNIQYIRAEAENARRIGREDAQKAREFSITSFGKDMLEVCDTMERCVKEFEKTIANKPDPAVEKIFQGVKMTDSVLRHNLKRHEIHLVEVKPGDKFDPNVHEALFNAPETEEIKEGHITTVVKTGYMIKQRVLRAAQVGVAEAAK